MATTTSSEHLIFRRKSDGLVYRFSVLLEPSGERPCWVREDKDTIVVQWSDRWGWIVASRQKADAPMLLALPWDIHKEEQGEQPPEGVWVSKLGDKSYIYQLIYEKS